MKKPISYLLVALMVIAVVVLIYLGQHSRPRVLDERLSFRKRDKIPYGLFVAYKELHTIFPKASVTVNAKEPGYWDSLSTYGENQALVIVCPSFEADLTEMKTLLNFAENGNSVFISTMNLSFSAAEVLKCDVYSNDQVSSYFGTAYGIDTLTLSLARPPFAGLSYSYPGKRFDSYFSHTDTSITTILGYDVKGHPDFIRLKAGKGNIFVHLAPMAFTNYFLLHKQNFPYYDNALSLIPAGTSKVAWDEYYLRRNPRDRDEGRKGWLATLLGLKNADGKKPFLTAFWILILLLALYVLMEMRRKQRFIPVVKRPRNDSLDFVKTIGRLYHDKGDHQNLCRKMAAYFLEHVRNRYKVPTSQLNNDFIKTLNAKTGIPENEINGIVYFIRELDNIPAIGEKQLISFHHQLESFYKKE